LYFELNLIFTDSLLSHQIDANEQTLPSPIQLKRKIILKVRFIITVDPVYSEPVGAAKSVHLKPGIHYKLI
jgi:hypothetical protein